MSPLARADLSNLTPSKHAPLFRWRRSIAVGAFLVEELEGSVVQRAFIVLWILAAIWALGWVGFAAVNRWERGFDLEVVVFAFVAIWLPVIVIGALQFIMVGFADPRRLRNVKPSQHDMPTNMAAPRTSTKLDTAAKLIAFAILVHLTFKLDTILDAAQAAQANAGSAIAQARSATEAAEVAAQHAEEAADNASSAEDAAESAQQSCER